MEYAAIISPLLKALIDITRKRLSNLSKNLDYVKHSAEEVPVLRALVSKAVALLYNRDHILQLQVDNFDVQEQVYIITSICYDAEDAVHEMEFESMMSALEPVTCRSGAGISVRRNHNRIRDLTKKLEDAVQNLQSHLQSVQPQLPGHENNIPIDWFLPPSPDLLVGRNEEIEGLVTELTSPERQSLGVTITGMNGIGKTALAHKIQNHAIIMARYPLRLWVSLSGPFNPQEVLEELVKDYIIKYKRQLDHDLVRHKITKILQNNKWLIVLDNLLNVTSKEVWSHFWSMIHNFPQHGKLIITTVNRDVALATKTTSHRMKSVPNLVCELLITRMLNKSRDVEYVSTLAQMCHGFPRVAIILANHFNNDIIDNQEDQGGTLLNRDLWEIQDFKRFFVIALATSYSMLEPHYVKMCFSYFSLFPPGYHFKREDLIHLWIGERLLRCQSRSSLENIGMDYFHTLWKWSVIQVSEDSNEQKTYEIHKFTHMFSELIASKTCLRLDEDVETRPWDISIRHLSLVCRKLQRSTWNNILTLKGLRTFLPLCPINIGKSNLQHILKNLVYIRVLSLSESDVAILPECIKMLKLLRYLDISKTQIVSLPNSASQLYNLQILKLKGCPKLKSLPKDFNKLLSLRHIDWEIADLRRLTSMPSGIGKLTCLQTLPLFTIGKTEGHTIRELKDMNRLKGSIYIKNLENIKDEKEAAAAELSCKTSIERLELEVSKDRIVGRDVFRSLEPPNSVKKLHITNYSDPMFPEWLSHLHKLEDLYIQGWHCSRLSSSSIRFPQSLQTLTLKDTTLPRFLCCRALDGVDATDTPHLHRLVIKECPNQTSLPSLEHLTSLTDLQISECDTLGVLPELPPSLNKLTITNCAFLKERCQRGASEWPKIRRIPTLVIDGNCIITSYDTFMGITEESPGYKSLWTRVNQLFRAA
ncbi:putative disease resistance protein At3g14460 [Chenopodium quinoa]|uniref:Uncharacterized protein n=1 Tax=Chenopodium quinoa TaxID=63459 RepID=A0A803LZW4_CHEQI|nr:putative disease resistance protein At3g14460 [Chenopodium quinoa]